MYWQRLNTVFVKGIPASQNIDFSVDIADYMDKEVLCLKKTGKQSPYQRFQKTLSKSLGG